MLQPTPEILQSLLNLKRSNAESYKVVADWLQQSLFSHSLALSDVEGEEKTNVMKGRVRELKQLDLLFSHTEQIIEKAKDGQRQSENINLVMS